VIPYLPEWMTYEIEQALRGLTRKQRTTVLKLAASAATPGRTMSDVFREPDCCNRSTWYDRPAKAGWESDPQIQHALALATERAQHWQDTTISRHIATAQRKLAQASPPAVDRMISLMKDAADERVQLRAAEGILDRTAQETAIKSSLAVEGALPTVTDEELDAIEEALREQATGGGATE
jgi:hypothetical protein